MNAVGGFVHLYHVWGIWGLITAMIYGPRAWASWRASGGKFATAPGEYLNALNHQIGEVARDIGRLMLGISRGLFGIGPMPPEETPSPWPYSKVHMLTLGITLGGVARFLTAIYWSERNRAWMTEQTVWIPAIPVLIAVVADVHHHVVAFEHRPWVSRWLKIAALLWIALGLLGV